MRSLTDLSGATCFSKLNAKDGFWSIHLDEDSSYLTSFNTHHGRYRFLHMPFSLKMSQDVFQMWMDHATDCLPGIIAIHDDICIFGHTPEKHDEHLLCLMHSAKTHGIVFNSTKCHIRQAQIAFYGAVFMARAWSRIPPKPRPYKTFLPRTHQTKLQSSVDFSYCWFNLVEVWYSLEQYIGLKEDKLSSTTVDFLRSEGNLETKHLYWLSKPKMSQDCNKLVKIKPKK